MIRTRKQVVYVAPVDPGQPLDNLGRRAWHTVWADTANGRWRGQISFVSFERLCDELLFNKRVVVDEAFVATIVTLQAVVAAAVFERRQRADAMEGIYSLSYVAQVRAGKS